jgi:hypothetical protein
LLQILKANCAGNRTEGEKARIKKIKERKKKVKKGE